jgi:hypothetical protein
MYDDRLLKVLAKEYFIIFLKYALIITVLFFV